MFTNNFDLSPNQSRNLEYEYFSSALGGILSKIMTSSTRKSAVAAVLPPNSLVVFLAYSGLFIVYTVKFLDIPPSESVVV